MRRQVMVPPQDALLVRSAHPFILDLTQKGATVFHAYSLPEKSGDGCFVLCAPPQNHSEEAEISTLKLTVFTPEKVCHTEAEIRAIRASRIWQLPLVRILSKAEHLAAAKERKNTIV